MLNSGGVYSTPSLDSRTIELSSRNWPYLKYPSRPRLIDRLDARSSLLADVEVAESIRRAICQSAIVEIHSKTIYSGFHAA